MNEAGPRGEARATDFAKKLRQDKADGMRLEKGTGAGVMNVTAPRQGAPVQLHEGSSDLDSQQGESLMIRTISDIIHYKRPIAFLAAALAFWALLLRILPSDLSAELRRLLDFIGV